METFTGPERALLGPYVSNTDSDVFAVTGLPEAVTAGVLARYSRSAKGFRRLLVDEFADILTADAPPAKNEGSRAEELMGRLLVAYGDDSVAQLGTATASVENCSNLLAKQLEWGRLAAYLEKSTRYVPYTGRGPDGNWRYVTPTEIAAGPHADRYTQVMDDSFAAYSGLVESLTALYRQRHPQDRDTSDVAYANTIRAKALDTARGLLPAATTTNVGIVASGQAWEQAIMRLRGNPLAEVRTTGDALLNELRTVIPSFLRRADMPDRGGQWTDYLTGLTSRAKDAHDDVIRPVFGTDRTTRSGVRLVSHGPEGADIDVIVGLLYAVSDQPEENLRFAIARLSQTERADLLVRLTGDRANRRHKPGRGLERAWYRFEIVSDYGAFRDLQRHRMATIDWQPLGPHHGHTIPDDIQAAGPQALETYTATLDAQADLHARLNDAHGRDVAQYAVGFAFNLRYSIQANARALMHLIELRTQPQGHPSYRAVCQDMHRLISGVTPAIGALMSHVDHDSYALERLAAERRNDHQRSGNPSTAALRGSAR